MKPPATQKAITRLLLHLHPPKIDEQAIKWNRTFGLGGIAALLFVILFFTGLLLRFVYVPSVEGAYDSIVALNNNTLFGRLLRNLHYWSATLLVIVTFLHLVRVFYSQSIYYERRKNWLYGLLLLFLVVSSNFTGYLLPWDQLAFWAVTIMTNMLTYIPLIGDGLANLIRGGEEVNANTLLRFYHFHTGLLPLLMVFFMSVHFWLVRKVKGVTVKNPAERKMVDTNPHLVSKEVFVALALIIFLLLFAMFFNAPLQDKAQPTVSPNPSKAPWYFMGFQELLLNIHPTFASFIIPALALTLFIYLPFMKFDSLNTGTWFNSPRGKQATLVSALFSVVFTLTLILLNEYVFNFTIWLPGWPPFISSGVIMFLLYVIPTGAFLYFLKIKTGISRVELLMSAVTVLLTAYLVMMAVGSLLRGEGMKLFG